MQCESASTRGQGHYRSLKTAAILQGAGGGPSECRHQSAIRSHCEENVLTGVLKDTLAGPSQHLEANIFLKSAQDLISAKYRVFLMIYGQKNGEDCVVLCPTWTVTPIVFALATEYFYLSRKLRCRCPPIHRMVESSAREPDLLLLDPGAGRDWPTLCS